jgi:hypothetical protein
MTDDLEERPVTLSQLKAVLAEFRADFKLEMRGEMTSLLARFYADILEPRFQAIDRRFDGIDVKLDEHDVRFDDLYKKFEDLHQEYVISNEQMRRLQTKLPH